jgi:hypothetical protein
MNNSLLFTLAIRRTLCEFLSYSQLDLKAKKYSKHFVMYEATDYEIMSLLMTGDYPVKKYNPLKEEKLYNQCKNIILENISEISPYIEKSILKNIITELAPIKGSSNVLLKEYINEQIQVKHQIDPQGRPNWKAIAGAAFTAGMAANVGNPLGKDLYEYGKKNARQGLASLMSYLKSTNGKMVGSVMAASLIVYASIIIYHKYFSNAAVTCKNLKGNEKDHCVKKIKMNALKNQINTLKQGSSACYSKENQDKCQRVIKMKILKLQLRLQKLERS